ncbi:inhibitor of Bruton tyrosine kinase-like [Styela clava]
MSVPQEWYENSECGQKCRSPECVADLNCIITKGNALQIKEHIRTSCPTATIRCDTLGRSAIHLAASCGKIEVLDWLIATFNCNLNVQDRESGWTPLHRAVYYGRLGCVILLIEHGANMWVRDKEGMTPMDIAMLDCSPWVRYLRFSRQTYKMPCVLNNSDTSEVYTWGINDNFVLGQRNLKECKLPEPVDFFVKRHINIKEVATAKFHTIFVTTSGSVYSCGHGEGGRLGNGNQEACLEPAQVSLSIGVCVLSAAVGLNHTVLTTDSGHLLVCGLNKHHILGVSSSSDRELVPVRVHGALKTLRVIGCAAGVLHTVVWTDKGRLYTFGANAGQLGHAKNDLYVKQPRQVSGVYKEGDGIICVHACDSATIVSTRQGTVYLLQNYVCRKIVSKQLDIVKVQIGGGRLDVSALSQIDQRLHSVHNLLKDDSLHVIMSKKSGDILSWSKAHGTLDRCKFNLPQSFLFKDIAICNHGHTALLVTNTGQAFVAKYGNWKAPKPPRKNSQSAVNTKAYDSCLDMLDADSVQEFSLDQVCCVFRAHSGYIGPKAKAGAILQSEPRIFSTDVPTVGDSELQENIQKLWEDVTENDNVHDMVVAAVDSKGNILLSIPCHKFILASRSQFLRKIITHQTRKSTIENEDEITSEDVEQNGVFMNENYTVNIDHLLFENCDPYVLRNLIEFIYCESCELLRPKNTVPAAAKNINSTETRIYWESDKITNFSSARNGIDLSGKIQVTNGSISAFAVYQESDKHTKKSKSEKSSKHNSTSNLLSQFKTLAKKLGINRSFFDSITLQDGVIQVKKGTSSFKAIFPSFDCHKLHSLCDIELECSDGVILRAHKCILVARIEFFRSMLLSQWAESKGMITKVPIPSDIFKYVLEFSYTDSTFVLNHFLSPETLCEVMAAADQLLMNRLKDIVEVQVASLLTLKNVSSIIEFASAFHCPQLIKTCRQFIIHHLPALMHTPNFYSIEYSTLEEMEDSYRSAISAVYLRGMPPSTEGPPLLDVPENLESSSLFPIFEPLSPTDKSSVWPGEGPPSPQKKKSFGQRRSSKSRKKSFSKSSTGGIILSDLLSRNDKDIDSFVDRIASSKNKASLNENTQLDSHTSVSPPNNNASTHIDFNDNIDKKLAAVKIKPIQKGFVPVSSPQNINKSNFQDMDTQKSQFPSLSSNLSQPNHPAPSSHITQNNPWGSMAGIAAETKTYPVAIPIKNSSSVNHGGSGAAITMKPKKLSQKQRKKLEKETAKLEVESVTIPAATSPPINAWGTVASPPRTDSRSFWDVMKEQSTSPSLIVQRPRVVSPDKMTKSEIDSPWQMAPKTLQKDTSKDSAIRPNSSFRDIMQSTMNQAEESLKRMNKPLHDIQLEDQAMAELKVHYQNTTPHIDEQFFTVERISAKYT